MRKNLLKSLALMVMTSLLTLTVVAANPQIYKITAYINNELKFTVNGESFHPKDENSKSISPIVYDNRTYLPVRAISEAVGLDVDYDESTNTIVIGDDLSGGIPYNDSKDTGSKPPAEKTKDPVTAPALESKSSSGKLVLQWKKVTDPRLQGYKVVISKDNPTPAYPNDGYLYWITDPDQTSAVVDNSSKYNSGDFGGYLVPGETYYFSVTVLYDGGKVSTNTLKLKYPDK